MTYVLKLGLYGLIAATFFTLATLALPVIWTAEGCAHAYRKLAG